MLLSENFHTSINIFCWPWNSVSLSITLPSFRMVGQLVTKIWEILDIKRLEYAPLGHEIWAETGRNGHFCPSQQVVRVTIWLIFRATGVPIQVVLYLISPIFLLPKWPSIPKLGKVMDKDTLFHGKQKMLIDVWKFPDNSMVQVLSPSPTEDSAF